MPQFSRILPKRSMIRLSSPRTAPTKPPFPASASSPFRSWSPSCAFKGSLQSLHDELFATLNGSLARVVSKSALSQARQKLKATAFEALNERLLCSLAALLPEPRWRGLRLVAVDSTTLRLPPWLENPHEFGVQLDSGGQPYVLARALGLFATTSRLMLKATLAPFASSERVLLASLLPHRAGDDLLIMDRGFPAIG